MTEALLEATGVSKIFPLTSGWLARKQSLKAVTEVSLSLLPVKLWDWLGSQGAENPLWAVFSWPW